MAVEILILSGARRNERITLDGRAFQVGSDSNCEVFFDPQRDPAVQGRSAKFRLQEGGWYVRCAGGEMWIKNRPVVGATHVRSGDVIRMSESGPEFSFHIVAATSASPTKVPGNGIVSPLPLGEGPGARTSQPDSGSDDGASNVGSAPPEANGLSLATPAPLPTNRQAVAAEAPVPRSRDRQWGMWVVGGLAVGILVLVAARAVFSPSTINVTVNQPVATTSPVGPPNGPSPEIVAPNKEKTVPPPKKEDKPPDPNKEEREKPAEQADLRARLDDTVYLIVVETAGYYWPYATCVAVGNDTLLTTAREAAELAKWRDEGTYKIWVTRPGDNLKFKFKAEVQDIRVMAPFAPLPEESTDLFFVDIGLVTVQGPLPKTVPLASSKELDEVEEGFPVVCFGFTHEGHKMTRFDKLEPRLTGGKVFGIAFAQKLPGQPKLLHVQAKMPENAFGSPVVNEAGKLLGLYGDAIPDGKGQKPKNLHYVTMVNQELIDSWVRDRDAKIWVPASPAPTTPKD